MCTNPMPPNPAFTLPSRPHRAPTMLSSIVMQHDPWPRSPVQHGMSCASSEGVGLSGRRLLGWANTVGIPSSRKHAAPCGSCSGSTSVRQLWCTIILLVESPIMKMFAFSSMLVSASVAGPAGRRLWHPHSSPTGPHVVPQVFLALRRERRELVVHLTHPPASRAPGGSQASGAVVDASASRAPRRPRPRPAPRARRRRSRRSSTAAAGAERDPRRTQRSSSTRVRRCAQPPGAAPRFRRVRETPNFPVRRSSGRSGARA